MTLEDFAQKVQEGRIQSLIKGKVDCQCNRDNEKIHIHQGKKWTRIDTATSGLFMINPEGQIYGIKAYGVPHLGHYHGTLENPNPDCFRGNWG